MRAKIYSLLSDCIWPALFVRAQLFLANSLQLEDFIFGHLLKMLYFLIEDH